MRERERKRGNEKTEREARKGRGRDKVRTKVRFNDSFTMRKKNLCLSYVNMDQNV